MRHSVFAFLLCTMICDPEPTVVSQIVHPADSKPAPASVELSQSARPQPADKNPDGSPKYNTYEDYIEGLVDWKIDQRISEIKQGPQKPMSSPRPVPVERSRACSPAIDSQIEGDFNGWEGETIYRLQNGQIWRQSSYHYHYHYAYAPHVLIFDSGTGCAMVVRDDNDQPVQVERLK